jgi:hypothetical protein
MSAAAIGRQLGGVRQGNNWRVPCPLDCGYTLSLRDGRDGQLVLHCFGGCDYDDLLPELVEYGLGDADDCDRAEPDKREKIELARQLYGRLQPAVGTLAERYLRGRAISLPVPPILRFGACPHHSGVTLPALAAPITDVSGEQIGVHLTFLPGDGTKLARDTYGRVKGGAIRLAAHDPERELVIAEGVETTLSAMQLFQLPGWAACSAGNIVELPVAIRRVALAIDNDKAGRQSGFQAFERWTGEGRAVRRLIPKISKDDFNDVLRRGHNVR